TSGVVVNAEGVLKLDNTGTNNTNRVRDAATVTLAGGTLWFVGNTATASTETLGALTLGAGASAPSIIRSEFGGVAGQQLTFASITRAVGSTTLSLMTNSDFVVGTNEVRF